MKLLTLLATVTMSIQFSLFHFLLPVTKVKKTNIDKCELCKFLMEEVEVLLKQQITEVSCEFSHLKYVQS